MNFLDENEALLSHGQSEEKVTRMLRRHSLLPWQQEAARKLTGFKDTPGYGSDPMSIIQGSTLSERLRLEASD